MYLCKFKGIMFNKNRISKNVYKNWSSLKIKIQFLNDNDMCIYTYTHAHTHTRTYTHTHTYSSFLKIEFYENII